MKGTYKKIIIGIVGLAILVFGTSDMFYKGFLRFNYPSSDKFPIRGIDVSHHQNEITWEQVKNQNIHFAFVKATEGGDYKDKKFNVNWNGASSVGIDIGAYHFFTFCKSGREQAQNFIETVPIAESILPPVIDLEFGGNCAQKQNDLTVLREIDTLQLLLKEEFKKAPILYVTREFYERFLINRFLNNPIWIRDIYREPTLIDQRRWVFWQYANRGHLEGINTYVDLNVFNGTKEEYNKLIK